MQALRTAVWCVCVSRVVWGAHIHEKEKNEMKNHQKSSPLALTNPHRSPFNLGSSSRRHRNEGF